MNKAILLFIEELLEIQKSGELCVFFSYSGHVNHLDWNVTPNATEYNNVLLRGCIHCDSAYMQDDLQESREALSDLLLDKEQKIELARVGLEKREKEELVGLMKKHFPNLNLNQQKNG